MKELENSIVKLEVNDMRSKMDAYKEIKPNNSTTFEKVADFWNQTFNKEKISKEDTGKVGGSYRDVKNNCDSILYEVHHIPADSVSNLDREHGPAIRMEINDHRETGSCGNSKEAQEYRSEQKRLIDEGKFREAVQMDIDDIRDHFGDKYDKEIKEMLEYVDQLEKRGEI